MVARKESGMDQFTRIRYEKPSAKVARITLARAEAGNAQDTAMLYEIDAAFSLAGQDDEVAVVVLAADGDDFSLGHDVAGLFSTEGMAPVTQSGGFGRPGIEGTKAWEDDIYLALPWRWRSFPKPTIAQVQGRVVAGGLMLVWPCDLVIASEDATFCDPVTGFAIGGVEIFLHPWEFGARRAKELLFTGDDLSAADACAIGMVTRVVPRAELESTTLALAERIAVRPGFGLKMAKLAVNQALDTQGQWTAVQTAYSLHHLAHAQALLTTGQYIDPAGFDLAPSFKEQG